MRVQVMDCDDAAFALIAPMLRKEDQTEWRLFAGGDAPTMIRNGWKLPVGAGTLNRIAYTTDGVPLCVWGASPAPDLKTAAGVPGWVWLVATPEAVPHAQSIHRHLAVEFGRIVNLYGEAGLVTASWLGNKVHHEWLDWLGFKRAPSNWLMSSGGVFIPFHFKA